MRKFSLFVVIVLCLPFMYGFATVVSGTKQNITVNSSPSGADVIIDGFVKGSTPLSFDLKRKKNQSISIRKEGYKTQTLSLAHEFNMAFWGNALIGGLIGSSIDSSTGAIIEYEPSNFHVTLEPERMSKSQQEKFNQVVAVRNYILSNYYNLTSDIAQGEGQYLNNLRSVFLPELKDSEQTLEDLKSMITEYQNISEFTEAVVRSFIES